MKNTAHRIMSLVLAFCFMFTVCTFGELGKYDPAVVTIAVTSTTLLAADTTTRTLKIVQLTNTGNYDVWFCNFAHTPVVGRGFYLPVGSTMILTGNTVPQEGLKAIANGGSTTVAIGKG